mmetsp:Transcript_3630/g.6387  ORF Transcript_3630/g.6387 Transcript_3630/m.6387 type:complete len:298 (+) Transcript_3630:4357-5250(+)
MQEGQGVVQLTVCLFFLCGNDCGILFTILLDDTDFVSFLLSFGLFTLHLHEELVRLFVFQLQHLLLLNNLNFHLLHVHGCLSKLLQTNVHTFLLHIDLLILQRIELLVVFDEAQEAPGSHVDVLSHSREVERAHVTDGLLEGSHELVQTLTILVRSVNAEITEKVCTYCNQCLLRPWQEPVDVHSTENCWEHLRSHCKLAVQRREGEHNMQVVSESIQEVLVEIHWVLFSARVVLDVIVANLGTSRVLLIFLHEPHNLTRGQNRVHILQEIFVLDILVCEDEGDILVFLSGADVKLF